MGDMTVAQLSQYLRQLESTSSRLEITAILAQVFTQLKEEEIKPTCYLLQGQVLPQYTGVEFQISVKTLVKVLGRFVLQKERAEASLFGDDQSESGAKEVETLYKTVGDLGIVAEQLFMQSEHIGKGEVSLVDLYQSLLQIAQDSGAQSQQRKQDKTAILFAQLDPVSVKFVTRILLGRLRLGFSDMTIIDALSWAMCGDKSERSLLEDAYQRRADIGALAQAYMQQKDTTKRHELLTQLYTIELGTPVVPALCQRLNSATEVIEKMTEVIAEPKYDGLRVQIHFSRGKKTQPNILKTFTRNLEDSTAMFPELETIGEYLHCDACILDAEAIGYDPTTGNLISFQQTSQRKRKHGVAEKAQEVPVRFYIFDILHLDGKDLLQRSLKERKATLKTIFQDNSVLVHTEQIVTSDAAELQAYHQDALAEGLEGVVMKQTSSSYQSGRKGWSWVKMKEAEGQSGKLNDTVDAVVMGYYSGRGKRAGFGLGAFLVGIWDAQAEQVLTIAKIGTGLTEERLTEVKKRCDALAVPAMPEQYQVDKMLVPDVWCAPGLVVEIAADELTTSPIHTAGKALRFPRFLRFRDDKNWQQATTSEELRSIQVA